mgnify:CR=1 FL=1
MRTLSITLALTLALAAGTGCEETQEVPNPAIDTTVALQTAETVLMLASLGAEVGHVLEAPDFTFGACPTVDADGDELVLDYGAGCAPGSATTAEELSGLVELVSPATNSIAAGFTTAFGFADLPVAGDFTLSTQRTGDTVRVDFEVEELSWTAEGLDRSLSGLFNLSMDPDGTTISLSGANLTRDGGTPIALSAADIAVAAGALGVCPQPSAGSILLERDGEEVVALFDESTATDGGFAVTLDDGTEGTAVLDCLSADE